jgi:hypothetical protein
MNERDLRRALRELPVPRAGQTFTREVLQRLERAGSPATPAPAPRRWAPRWSLAAAAALTLALGAAAAWRFAPEPTGASDVHSLHQESERLRGEIRALERRLDDTGTLLYVGGTETIDLVLDLSQLPAFAPLDGAEEARPPRDGRSGGVL